MLSKSNTFLEFEKAHKELNLKEVAEELSLSETKLKQVLKSVGYRYNSATKKWNYVWSDDSKDFRKYSIRSILDNGIPSNNDITKIEQQEAESIDITVGNTSNIEGAGFTQEEIIVLKQLAQKQTAVRLNGSVSDGSNDVLKAIQQVPSGSTSKKTFVIQDSVIAQLDAFCDHHRIKKSDFLAVAIQEALSKYS